MELINKNTNFNLKRFLTSTISFGVLHTSLICCVLIQYFQYSGMLPFQLSIIIVSKRILKIFCDFFFGLLFDRLGAKFVFLIGRILKLISYLILLFSPNFIGFVVAMLLDGASYSSIYGKISSYIYNNLSANNQIKKFPKSLSLYYLSMDITLASLSFLSGIILQNHGYNILIYISIITNIFSIFILISFLPKDTNKHLNQFKSKSFYEIFITLKKVILTKPQILNLIFLYSIISFLAWQFHSISSLVLLDMKLTGAQLAFCGSGLKLTMAIGAVLSIILFSKKINLKLKICIKTVLFILLFGLISILFYNKILFYLFCLFIALVFTTTEVAIENNFEFFSDKKIRGTAISIAMTCCSLIAILANLFVGIVAQFFSYKIALIFIFILLIISLFVLYKKIEKIDI